MLDTARTAKSVILSHAGVIKLVGYAKNVTEKPKLSEILQDGSVQFTDGSTSFVEAIIFCTGYNYKYPFLTPECGITVESNHVRHLYKHTININRPTMFFPALPWYHGCSMIYEFQVRCEEKLLIYIVSSISPFLGAILLVHITKPSEASEQEGDVR